MKVWVFNPEHDYALAHGGSHYMAPASVRRLAHEKELLPLAWARKGDGVLVRDCTMVFPVDGNGAWDSAYGANGFIPDASSVYSHSIPVSEIMNEITEIEPWGWDMAVRHRLLSLGFPESLLPSPDYIDSLRRLSHRRISIAANRFLGSPLIPEEFSKVDEAMEFYRRHPGCYFKLPWSSGGRGVLATAELSSPQVREWVSGGIRRQGSVMGEPGVARVIDFASLWTVEDGDVTFEGWSVSLSDGRGKYDGNVRLPQEELLALITRHLPRSVVEKTVERQREFIRAEIAPHYQGKMGIDMMADGKGNLYPCVEVNLRRTMGHVVIALDFLKWG